MRPLIRESLIKMVECVVAEAGKQRRRELKSPDQWNKVFPNAGLICDILRLTTDQLIFGGCP
jgi:hypothetical protein